MPRSLLKSVVFAAIGFGLNGCIDHVHQPYAAQEYVSPPAAPGPFVGPRAPVEMTLAEPPRKQRTRHYDVQQFSFAATGNSGQVGNAVSGRLFSGDAAGPRPVVIVLPVWGISEYPSRKLARDLMKRTRGRIDIMLVESNGYLIDWDSMARAESEVQFRDMAREAAARVRDAVIDARRMVDWLEQQPQIDPQRIGIAGFSLSAVAVGLALPHEPRFAAGVVILGGSNPAEIFAVCDGRPGEVREAVRERFGWSQEQYFEVFEEAMVGGDASIYPGRVADPSSVLFVEAVHDDCMTLQSRNDLWKVLGQPERISFGFRHRPTFYAMTPLGFNVLGGHATRFLEDRLLD